MIYISIVDVIGGLSSFTVNDFDEIHPGIYFNMVDKLRAAEMGQWKDGRTEGVVEGVGTISVWDNGEIHIRIDPSTKKP